MQIFRTNKNELVGYTSLGEEAEVLTNENLADMFMLFIRPKPDDWHPFINHRLHNRKIYEVRLLKVPEKKVFLRQSKYLELFDYNIRDKEYSLTKKGVDIVNNGVFNIMVKDARHNYNEIMLVNPGQFVTKVTRINLSLH